MLYFQVQFYTNFFFKAQLNSCHPREMAFSELLQKRYERFELQRSFSHALISIRFVFQTGVESLGNILKPTIQNSDTSDKYSL